MCTELTYYFRASNTHYFLCATELAGSCAVVLGGKMLICAYCECQCQSFDDYKSHLKILHNKQTYGIGN